MKLLTHTWTWQADLEGFLALERVRGDASDAQHIMHKAVFDATAEALLAELAPVRSLFTPSPLISHLVKMSASCRGMQLRAKFAKMLVIPYLPPPYSTLPYPYVVSSTSPPDPATDVPRPTYQTFNPDPPTELQ